MRYVNTLTFLPLSRIITINSTEFGHLLLRRPYDVPYRATPTLEDWTAVTAEEIQKLISSAPNKTRELDRAPTWLVKDMRGLLSPFISLLINKSLTADSADCFPAAFKEALVRPLLKKVGLDAGDQKSFRPVSNLPFLSKLLEIVLLCRPDFRPF